MSLEKLLISKQIKPTPHRLKVLEYLKHAKVAVTHADIQNNFSGIIDRVSIYRILISFEEVKLICKLVDSNSKVCYIFLNPPNEYKSMHPLHFKCKNCNDVLALPELPESYLDLLKGLRIERLNLLVEGTCPKCDKTT